MKPTIELPDDAALPGIVAIRVKGLAGALPTLGFGDAPVDLQLCGYTPGERATLEARAGRYRVAVKAYAEDPTPEAELYQALAEAGAASDRGAQVPPLLVWERDLRVLVIGWLDGPTAHQLVKGGQGTRAGELAARWLRHAATLSVTLGPTYGAARAFEKAQEWVAGLVAADGRLGATATMLAETLARTQPRDNDRRLIHGTLYDRHVLDTGDGPGVIDWQRFGQGPLELDAGVFLATISRIALRHPPLADESARTEEALRAGTRSILDHFAVAWHRAVTLLRLASKPVSAVGDERLRASHKPDRRALALARSQTLLDEAERQLAAVGARSAVAVYRTAAN